MEHKESVDSSGRVARARKPRLLVAYAVAGLLVLSILGITLVVLLRETTPGFGDPHINLASGSTNGVAPDSRSGLKLPSLGELKLEPAARLAGCKLQLHLRDEGHDHIPPDAPTPRYGTEPPSSGPHVEPLQADGAYAGTPPAVSIVHALEHGRMAIQYQPSLPHHAQRELLGLYGTMYGGTLLFPNTHMPYAVAAVTWTNLLICDEYRGSTTLQALLAFGKATWGRYGGEPVTDLDPAAPTPLAPELTH